MKLGRYIGAGCFRLAYRHPTDRTKVIKRAIVSEYDEDYYPEGFEHNLREYRFYQRASRATRRWLAPAYEVSKDGEFLVMARTTHAPLHVLRRQSPRVPAFFDDIHDRNWGLLGSRVVCHDYAYLKHVRRDPRIKQRVTWT